jgi:hypothetical protein
MDKPIIIAALMCSFCLFVAIGLYFAQKDIEARNFSAKPVKNIFSETGQGSPTSPADAKEREYPPPVSEAQGTLSEPATVPENVATEFHASEVVENNLPQSIEFWTQAYCPGDDSAFDYKIPAGYRIESCEYGESGRHNGCPDCTMVKIRLTQNETGNQSDKAATVI